MSSPNLKDETEREQIPTEPTGWHVNDFHEISYGTQTSQSKLCPLLFDTMMCIIIANTVPCKGYEMLQILARDSLQRTPPEIQANRKDAIACKRTIQSLSKSQAAHRGAKCPSTEAMKPCLLSIISGELTWLRN